MQKPTELILKRKYPNNFYLYLTFINIVLKSWQLLAVNDIIRLPRYMLNWGRGMSKTFLLAVLAVFFGIQGLTVCYMAPQTDQLIAFTGYLDNNPFVDSNPYKKTGDKSFFREKTKWYKINGRWAIRVIHIDDKGKNVSSSRINVNMVDEAALLMFMSKELYIYEKLDGMLRVADNPKEIIASTPLFGSHFLTLLKDNKLHHPERISHRNFKNTPDNYVSNTPSKRQALMESKAKAKRLGMLNMWECENYAIAKAMGGNPFPNVIWSNFITHPDYDGKGNGYRDVIIPLKSFTNPLSLGLDYHGPDIGHVGVEWWWSVHAPSRVYATREFAHLYEDEDTGEESVSFLKEPYYQQIPLKRAEEYGFNSGYYKDSMRHGVQAYDISGNKKHNSVYNFKQFHVYIDPVITPLLAHDVENANWVNAAIFKIMKKASGIVFRNHYIDAGLIGLPTAKKGGFEIPDDRDNQSYDDGAGGLKARRKRAHQ